MNEIVREFLLETHENLSQLDLDLVTLEKEPTERETLARTFRALHTVKGTAGFLGLVKLQAVAHAAENLLSQLRSGEKHFNPQIASALLGSVDAIRQMLAAVEATETEGDGDYSPQIAILEELTAAPGSGIRPKSSLVVPLAAPTAPAPLPATGPNPTPPQSTIAPPPASPAASPAVIPSTPQPIAPVLPKPATAAAIPPTQPVLAVNPTSQTIVSQSLPPLTLPATDSGSVETGEARASAVSDSSIRVDVNLLDKLMNLVGELVLARNQIVQYSVSQDDASFLGTVQRLNLLTTELQAGVMKTRMQPIGNIWTKFPRLVRDMAAACGKQVRIEMEGRETELDKTIIEAIRDPLTHLVRNGIDHGIEPPDVRVANGKLPEGRLFLHAFHEGGKVIIEIADDGAGIDPQRVRHKAIESKVVTPEQVARMSDHELLNLVFLPGFSTAQSVTQFSGRGVGMDVVRTNIERIGGTVDLESRLGAGTTLRMKIPLTLAIIPALTITSGGDRYAIPQVSLLELVRLEGEQAARGIEQIHGAPVYRLRGNLLPLVYLDQQLEVEPTPTADAGLNIVVLQADDRQFGLVVDDIHDTEEIVVKPLQKQLKSVGAFAGATIMGDGTVALILDVLGLAQAAHVLTDGRERALAERPLSSSQQLRDKHSVLLFTSGHGGRMAVSLSEVARLEEFPQSALERTGSQYVVQYRNEILPLVEVDQLLNRAARGQRSRTRNSRQTIPDADRSANTSPQAVSETVQVVVHNDGKCRIGLLVGNIIDIVEEAIESRSAPSRPGILFSAVIQGRVTEFLDMKWVMRTMSVQTAILQPLATV